MSRPKKSFIEHPGERVQPVWHELPQDPPTINGWYMIWYDGAFGGVAEWFGNSFSGDTSITHWALEPFGPGGKRSA